MKRWIIMIGLAVILLAAGFAIFRNPQNQQEALSPDMEPVVWMRKMSDGKKTEDISKILITTPWSNDTITVTKRDDISAFLKGMQAAVEPKIKSACGGPRLTVAWKASGNSESYGFCTIHGPEHAYGLEFAKAWNRVAPPDRRIDLSKP